MRRETLLILVNKTSNSGEAAGRWERVKKGLDSRAISYNAVFPTGSDDCRAKVIEEIENGGTTIIPAGGDGTVNCALNAVMDPETDTPRGDIAFGGIALGSSNDFHKPFENYTNIDDITLRINHEKTTMTDVGKAEFTDTDGNTRTRYFILNSSIGFVAEGNALFHSGSKILNFINSKSNDLAIIYAILVNIVTFKRFKASIRLDDTEPQDFTVSAMGILKKVQFAGDMRYDTPVTADDGMFDVNLWENMGRIRLIKTLAALFDGRFTGLPNTRTWRAKEVYITPEKPVHLEFDGEIEKIVSAKLSVLPKILKVCG